MRSFGLTDKGKVRKDNQDSFIIERCVAKDCIIVALCDGMGGAKAGGLASQLANKAFVSYIYARLTSRVNKSPNFSEETLPNITEFRVSAEIVNSKFDIIVHKRFLAQPNGWNRIKIVVSRERTQ